VNSLSRLASVDLATGAMRRGEEVVGDPQGIARDGSWALFVRWPDATSSTRELFRLPIPSDGQRPMILATGDLDSAIVTESEDEAVLSTWSRDAASFTVIGLTEDVRARTDRRRRIHNAAKSQRARESLTARKSQTAPGEDRHLAPAVICDSSDFAILRKSAPFRLLRR